MNKCGCCNETFDSTNTMFEHIRQSRHAIVSDDLDARGRTDIDVILHADAVDGEPNKKWIPGTQVTSKRIKPKDLEWRDIGSGTVAKTFRGVTKLMTTTKRGPALEDIQIRRVWSLSRGVLIDECDVGRTPDSQLDRKLQELSLIHI